MKPILTITILLGTSLLFSQKADINTSLANIFLHQADSLYQSNGSDACGAIAELCEKALITAEGYPVIKSQAFRLLGLAYTTPKTFEKAFLYFDKAIAECSMTDSSNFQNTVDIYYDYATSLGKDGKFGAALSYHEKALDLLINNLGEAAPKVGECKSKLSRNYYNLRQLPLAQKYCDEAIENYQNNYGPNSLEITKLLDRKGQILYRYRKYNEATEILNRSFEIKTQLDTNETYSGSSYYHFAMIDYFKNDYLQALQNLQKCQSSLEKQTSPEEQELAACYYLFGIIYDGIFDYDKALQYYNLALNVMEKNYGEIRIASQLNGMGITYKNQGDYDRALDHHQKALNLLLKQGKAPSARIGIYYHNIGVVYAEQKKYEQAIEWYQKTLDIRLKTIGKYHPNTASTYNNIGVALRELNQLDSALYYHQTSLGIKKKVLNENDPEVAMSYSNLGATYLSLKDFENALTFQQKAYNVWSKASGENLSYFALGLLGDVYEELGDFDTALEYYQEALIVLVNDFDSKDFRINPRPGQSTSSRPDLLDALQSKADCLYSIFKLQNENTEALEVALNTFEIGLEFINLYRDNFVRDGSKHWLTHNALAFYEGKISTSFQLKALNSTNGENDDLFPLLEKSKAIMLLESMKNSKARLFSGIPQEIVQAEDSLKSAIAYFENLNRREKGYQTPNQDKIQTYTSNIFALKSKLDTLIRSMESNFPEYYNLKYDHSVIDIQQVKKQLLSPENAFLEYFVGDSSIFVQVITLESSKFIEIKKDFPIEDWVMSLQNSIHAYQKSGTRSEKQYLAQLDTFTTTAFNIYQKIFQPIEEVFPLPEKLIIAPDGILGYLSFDLLLKSLPKKNTLFKSHDYLIKAYQISYCYSATLLQEMSIKKHTHSPTKYFLGFAPSFNGKNSGLPPLKSNITEIEALKQSMGGHIFINDAASIDQFYLSNKNYQIIHLATHGKADDKVGDYSYLAFSLPMDSTKSGLLFTRDLYNLRLNSDLVVLSACETGTGELQRGEGIISLARGFSFAGTKSIITSIWSVNDASTSKLMQDFYHYLKEGKPKDESLRLAKLDYINNNSNIASHPFYWAAFIPIGDMSPVPPPRSKYLWWVLGFAMLIPIAFIFKKIKS